MIQQWDPQTLIHQQNRCQLMMLTSMICLRRMMKVQLQGHLLKGMIRPLMIMVELVRVSFATAPHAPRLNNCFYYWDLLLIYNFILSADLQVEIHRMITCMMRLQGTIFSLPLLLPPFMRVHIFICCSKILLLNSTIQVLLQQQFGLLLWPIHWALLFCSHWKVVINLLRYAVF